MVNINTAGVEELDTLPGIGEVLAARIVEYRNSLGVFESLEQLDEVKGIGPGTLEQIAPCVTLR